MKSEKKTDTAHEPVSSKQSVQKQELDLFAATPGESIIEETLPEGTISKEPLSRELTIEMVQKNVVDPMIGMENLSPYDFLVS